MCLISGRRIIVQERAAPNQPLVPTHNGEAPMLAGTRRAKAHAHKCCVLE